MGEQKTSRKNKKKQSCMDLPKILLTGCFFCFPRVFGHLESWEWKKMEKNKTCKNPTLPAFVSVFFFGGGGEGGGISTKMKG